ncbi:MAG: hypothetical protein RR387_04555 [Clostridiales bacterium]
MNCYSNCPPATNHMDCMDNNSNCMGDGFSCIINLIIVLIVLQFLTQIICNTSCN